LWAGAVDDLWAFGKPRGVLGVWRRTRVAAGATSDACLVAGFDRKRLLISHEEQGPLSARIEADFTGTGKWEHWAPLTVPEGETLESRFAEGFGAYWLRLVVHSDATLTATLVYE
jgi:hypothetical protein